MKLPPTVDRSIARAIAFKRIATGSAGLVASVVMTVLAARHGSATPGVGIAIAIFLGGGIWTLRDGLRLRRELLRTAN